MNAGTLIALLLAAIIVFSGCEGIERGRDTSQSRPVIRSGNLPAVPGMYPVPAETGWFTAS